MLRQKVLEVTHKAVVVGALRRIAATHKLLPANELGVQFILFSAQGKARLNGGTHPIKPQVLGPRQRKMDFVDPFAKANVDKHLFVARLYGTHFLIVNKFLVVDEHVVLAAVEYEDQQSPLNQRDFRCAWVAMAGLNALAFYNCGYASGASQPHKHMQLIPYRSMKSFCGLDMPPLLKFIDGRLRQCPQDDIVQLDELPFLHYLHRLHIKSDSTSEEVSAYLCTIYSKVLHRMNAHDFAHPTAEMVTARPVAYNLILTRSFLFVIPRKQPSYMGIDVNSMGFLGSVHERSEEQRTFLEAHGALELLKKVTFPPLRRARL